MTYFHYLLVYFSLYFLRNSRRKKAFCISIVYWDETTCLMNNMPYYGRLTGCRSVSIYYQKYPGSKFSKSLHAPLMKQTPAMMILVLSQRWGGRWIHFHLQFAKTWRIAHVAILEINTVNHTFMCCMKLHFLVQISPDKVIFPLVGSKIPLPFNAPEGITDDSSSLSIRKGILKTHPGLSKY